MIADRLESRTALPIAFDRRHVLMTNSVELFQQTEKIGVLLKDLLPCFFSFRTKKSMFKKSHKKRSPSYPRGLQKLDSSPLWSKVKQPRLDIGFETSKLATNWLPGFLTSFSYFS